MDDFTNQIGQALASTLSTDDPPINLISDNFGMSVVIVNFDGETAPVLDAGLSRVVPNIGQGGGANLPMQVNCRDKFSLTYSWL
mgnify:CR=1 FL=1